MKVSYLKPGLVCIGWEVERGGSQHETIKVLQFVREEIFAKQESGSVPKIMGNLPNFGRYFFDVNKESFGTRRLE